MAQLIAAAHHLNEDTTSGAGVALGAVRLPLHLDMELGDHLFEARPLLIRGGESLHGAEGVLIAPKLNAEPIEPVDVEGHVVRNHELRASEPLGERIASIIGVHPVRIHHQLCNASQLGDEITHGRPRLHERGPGGNFVIALVRDEANLNHGNVGLLAPDTGRLKVDRHPTLWESTTEPVARLWKDHAAIMRLRGYDVQMELILIAVAALAASAITLVSGFGLSTALVPIFALYFPLPLAIGAVAVVHLINSLFKVALLRHAINWEAALRFSLPAAAAAIVGASLLGLLGGFAPLLRYELGGDVHEITPLKFVVGWIILALVALEFSPAVARLRISPRALPLGGLLSGFFGGLTGNQGVLRSAFLIRLKLSPEGFAATGAVGAAIVDLSRLAIYGGGASAVALSVDGPLRNALICATVAALAGALIGRRLVRTMRGETLRIIVGGTMALIASLMVVGIV